MRTTSGFRATLSLITIGLMACTGLAVADSDNYAEDFESYVVGSAITNVSGWTATEATSVIAATNYTADYVGGDYPIDYNHSVYTNVLNIDNGVTNTVTAGLNNQTNWVDVVIKPVISEDTPALPPAGSVAAVHFNASSNLVVAYSPDIFSPALAWLAIPEFSVGADEWIRLTIAVNMKDGSDENEAVRYFKVYVNGVAVTNGAAYNEPTSTSALGGMWFASGASVFRAESITNVIIQGTGYIDDLVMTNSLTVVPAQPAVPSYIEAVAVSNVLSYGQTVAEAGVYGTATNALGANVPGQFAFDNPAAVPPVGTNSYAVTFTPDNPASYLTATGQVDVVVVAATTTIGTPVSWYEQFSIDPGTNTYDQLDEIDSDGDGVPNWQEFVAGTLPTNSNSLFRILGATVTSTNVTVRWIGGTNGPLVPYVVKRATSLGGGTIAWSNVSNHARQEGTNTWSDGAPGTMLFYQIRATSE